MTRTVQQLFNLEGKTALVTGGSRGLGLQMAYALGEAGGAEEFAEVRLDDGSVRRICRLLVRRGDAIVGVQMVGSREGFDAACEKWSGA